MNKASLRWALVIATLLVLNVAGCAEQEPDPEPIGALQVIDGVELHYQLWQPDKDLAGAVVLIHGLFGSTFSWRYTAPFLQEQGYLVVAVDLPGFGYSDRSRGFDHSQQNRGDLIWRFLGVLEEELGFAVDSWDLVGHSMGGGTITAMVQLKPAQVRSLTYVAGAVYQQPPRFASILITLPGLNRIVASVLRRVLLQPSRLSDALESAYGRPPTAAEVEGYYRPLTIAGTERSFIDIVRSQGTPVDQYLQDIAVPTLLIWGEKDTWVPLSEGERLAADIAHGELVVIPGSGHNPMETDPVPFNHLLSGFLRYF